jgi:hypothetical protein
MKTLYITVHVDIEDDTDPADAVTEVLDLVGNAPLDHIVYVLSAAVSNGGW